MSEKNDDPKQRLIHTAADLLRSRGLNSTSIRELAKHAKAPLGSTYHYFPGGKPQLISTAVRQTGGHISQRLAQHLETGPLAGTQAFLADWRDTLLKGEFKAGCPVIAVAADDSSGDGEGLPRAAAAEVLRDWERLLSKSLQQSGVEEQKAAELALLVIASIEGAILLCRVRCSITPFDGVAQQLLQQLRSAVDK